MEKDWKILLIDDDAGIRKVMSISLEDAGYHVVTAPDGETIYDFGQNLAGVVRIKFNGKAGQVVTAICGVSSARASSPSGPNTARSTSPSSVGRADAQAGAAAGTTRYGCSS